MLPATMGGIDKASVVPGFSAMTMPRPVFSQATLHVALMPAHLHVVALLQAVIARQICW